jgi:hypothetical protein
MLFMHIPQKSIWTLEGEMAGGWRKLYNEKLHNLNASPNIIKEDEIGGACSTHGRDEKYIQNFGGKT